MLDSEGMKTNRIWQPNSNRQGGVKNRFRILPFENSRTSSQSWRVTGSKRDGIRVRENFSDQAAAQARRVELETEWLGQQTDTALRATKLTEAQLRLAEVGFAKLEAEQEFLPAIDHWLKHGRQHSVKQTVRLDDAVDKYIVWLDASPFRDATKRHWRTRMKMFKNGVSNLRISDITPEVIENYLTSRKTSPGGKDTDRRAISRFFSWCIERPRRWTSTNPAREVKIDRGEIPPPEILTVDDCEKLLHAAEKHKTGLLVPYVAVCLIGGLRPDEAKRLTWQQVNLADKEIRLESTQTKTKKPRVVTIHPTLAQWLKRYQGKTFFPVNWRKEFDAVKEAAGFTGEKNPDGTDAGIPFPHDVMRHTAVSYFFRDCGSYGLAAEQFGNSEAIIKKHYQGRVSSADAKEFYSIKPTVKK